MDRAQQVEAYYKLERELIDAYTAQPCQRQVIERLTDELAGVQRRLRHRAPEEDRASASMELDLVLD